MHLASPHLRNPVLYPARRVSHSCGASSMNDNLAADYTNLVQDYCELTDRVRMIRRAVQKAFQAGVLSSVEPVGITPLQECEAIARAIHEAALNRSGDVRARSVAGLRPDFSAPRAR